MAYLIKRIPFAEGLFADENGKSNMDYFAHFEEKDYSAIREEYKTKEEAFEDGCKLITHNYDGQNVFHVVQGVNPDMVAKVWDIPKNENEAQAISVIYYYTSPSKEDGLRWLSKNLRIISSRFGINIHLKKFDEDRVNQPK